MREIKFRVWNTNLKKWVHPCVDITNSFNHDTPNKIMQYTGLTDKNGKEIYEGDILKYSIIGIGRDVETPVIWNNEFATFATEDDAVFDWVRYDGRYEVISNIHE